MKKLILLFTVLVGLICLSTPEVVAQTVSTIGIDAKTHEKVEKAKVKLIKYKEDHRKALEKRQDLRVNFEKKNSAGKLSPNDIEKITKKMEKQTKSIEKLEKKMRKLEEFIKENASI
ncbi:hypothetical protein U3A58_14510 [Algoriphagus sp. C2-6-M1]|uniref:hypothetical protein n=1 Tax=Algoriphagus persicinus TaxID=3108754 RepID=UPI002B3B28D6|nr:hypothetical protein [Algoriphagus sp. C2-6-M1]MEB2781606.1 hypothetical protein [Algoriphagus sp. C2-6-M1]